MRSRCRAFGLLHYPALTLCFLDLIVNVVELRYVLHVSLLLKQVRRCCLMVYLRSGHPRGVLSILVLLWLRCLGAFRVELMLRHLSAGSSNLCLYGIWLYTVEGDRESFGVVGGDGQSRTGFQHSRSTGLHFGHPCAHSG